MRTSYRVFEVSRLCPLKLLIRPETVGESPQRKSLGSSSHSTVKLGSVNSSTLILFEARVRPSFDILTVYMPPVRPSSISKEPATEPKLLVRSSSEENSSPRASVTAARSPTPSSAALSLSVPLKSTALKWTVSPGLKALRSVIIMHLSGLYAEGAVPDPSWGYPYRGTSGDILVLPSPSVILACTV